MKPAQDRPTPQDAQNPLLGEGAPQNPLFQPVQQFVDMEKVDFQPVHRRPIPEKKRLRMLWRRQSAAEAVEGMDKTTEIYGFTKGQFSLLDLIKAIIAKTGPVDFALSTWTANRAEAGELAQMQKAGAIRTMRWLTDLTFVRRDPEAAHAIRQTFGVDAIRIANVHSKFALFGNDSWRLVLRTSMNLNMNPRTEDFTVAHDPELYDFMDRMLEKIWKHQPGGLDSHRPYEVQKLFESVI